MNYENEFTALKKRLTVPFLCPRHQVALILAFLGRFLLFFGRMFSHHLLLQLGEVLGSGLEFVKTKVYEQTEPPQNLNIKEAETSILLGQ